jgi:hypothetical protein
MSRSLFWAILTFRHKNKNGDFLDVIIIFEPKITAKPSADKARIT